MGRRNYTGSDVEISYDVKRCIHAAKCVHGLPSVFDPNGKPWVNPDGASADEVAQAVAACPTGALQFRRLDGGAEEVAAAECEVRCETDGPVYASGDLRILGPSEGDEPEVTTEMRAAFCRCGQSANKPFCDGAHEEAGFEASGPIDRDKAVDDETAAGARAEAGGAVTVTPYANGPFLFDGVVRMTVDGEAEPATYLKPWLCRCGASKNKPFCDGSHKEIDFEAEGL